MTFNTHLGWYRFLQVSFGLKMSQDIFQMWMDNIVAQCPGILAIHDDICIHGKDDIDHDANIINLFNVAQKEWLVFSSAKCNIKQESVTFFGGVFSAKGYSPEPAKIQGITEMTPPQMKQLHLHITSKPSRIPKNSSLQKAFLPLWCLTMALHSVEITSRNLQENSTSFIQFHHLSSTSQMVSLGQWWRKLRTPTGQQMVSLQLKPEHYSSCMTHP